MYEEGGGRIYLRVFNQLHRNLRLDTTLARRVPTSNHFCSTGPRLRIQRVRAGSGSGFLGGSRSTLELINWCNISNFIKMYFGNINIFYIISGVIVIKLINLNMYRRKFFHQYYLFHIKKIGWLRIRDFLSEAWIGFGSVEKSHSALFLFNLSFSCTRAVSQL